MTLCGNVRWWAIGATMKCRLSRVRLGARGFTSKRLRRKGCSKATATRDLGELVELGIFQQLPGGGRSTSYELVLE